MEASRSISPQTLGSPGSSAPRSYRVLRSEEVARQRQTANSKNLVTLTGARAFIPEFLFRNEILRDVDAALTPTVHSCHAACMIADLSGFTQKSEELCAEGNEGIDELNKLINHCFKLLVDKVDECGGDIFKYAGDALLAFWPGGEDELSFNAMRAVDCALKLVELSFPDMTLHVGVDCGSVNVFVIGESELEWTSLVVGSCFTSMGEAETLAGHGEVVVGERCHELLLGRCSAVPVSSDDDLVLCYRIYSVEMGNENISELRREEVPEDLVGRVLVRTAEFVPPVVDLYEKISNEVRQLSVVFAQLRGPTIDGLMNGELSAMESMQSCFSLALRDIDNHGGQMYKFFVDDKGCLLIVAFGTPRFSHDDDSVRAAKFALSIYRKLREIGIETSMGVTTGPAFCGTQGVTGRRAEYAILGDVVNLSARLMVHAAKALRPSGEGEGEDAKPSILCDDKTMEFSKEYMQFGEEQLVSVKGKAVKVSAFQLLKAASALRSADDLRRNANSAGASAALWGRDEEMHTLKVAIEKTHMEGHVFFLRGQTGIGKSSVLNNVCTIAANDGRHVALVTVSPMDTGLPYRSFANIFRALLLLDGGDASSEPNTPRTPLLPNSENSAGMVVKRHRRNLLPINVAVEGLLDALKEAESVNYSILLQVCKMFLVEADSDLSEKFATVDTGDLKSGDAQSIFSAAFESDLMASKLKKNSPIIAIDDAHLMDTCSWSALTYILLQLYHKLFIAVIAIRPFGDDDVVSNVGINNCLTVVTDLYSGTVLDLPPLTRLAVQNLVNEQFGDVRWSDSSLDYLARASRGIPFQCKELARGMYSQAKLEGATFVRGRNSSENDISYTLKKLVVARMDQLTKNELAVLKVASVYGMTFTRDAIKDLAPHGIGRKNKGKELSAILSSLVKQEFLEGLQGMRGGYSFTNDFLQKVAYGLIMHSEQQFRHKQCAIYIEETFDADLRPYFATLMGHYEKSEVWEKALHFAILAIKMCMVAGAMAEAQTFVDRAIIISDVGGEGNSVRRMSTFSMSFKTKLNDSSLSQAAFFADARTGLKNTLIREFEGVLEDLEFEQRRKMESKDEIKPRFLEGAGDDVSLDANLEQIETGSMKGKNSRPDLVPSKKQRKSQVTSDPMHKRMVLEVALLTLRQQLGESGKSSFQAEGTPVGKTSVKSAADGKNDKSNLCAVL